MKRTLRLSSKIKGWSRLIALITSLFVLNSGLLLAQTREISGTVTASDDKTTIPGANILIKGTTSGTTTDADGKYKLSVDGNATLVISSIGYATQEIAVGNQTVIDFVLAPELSTLSEVVVIGYGSQKRKDVTGAISSVSAESIAKIPVSDVNQSLQGRASGVQVMNNDASPGGNVSVLIRGIGSLAPGGNTPLYVVDGYPTTDGINNINPNDIATIDVLKDASATAVYGVRAANGVVIITTKKGSKDKIQLSFDAYTLFQSKPKEYSLLGAKDWATLSNYVEANNNVSGAYKGLSLWHTPDALHSVDWQNAMYHSAVTQNYALSIRGGTDKVQTSVSFGNYDQKGIVLGSYFKRFTVGLNLDYQPTKWLKSSTSIKYTNTSQANPTPTGQLFNLVINPPTLDGGNSLTNEISDGKGNYGFYNPLQANVSKFGNPVYSTNTNQYENKNNYVLATTSLEATIFDGLKVKTNAGLNLNAQNGSFFQPQDSRANAQYPAATLTPGRYNMNLRNGFDWLWENTVSYDKTFGLHTINFVAGFTAQEFTNSLMSAGGVPPNNTTRDLAQSANVSFDPYANGRNVSTLASEFARLTYQYNDKYMITGTVRRDGSSKFGPGHRYGVFPSAAIGWRIKNESFLKDVSFIEDLKLRASYGRVGNQTPIGLYQYQAWYVGNFPVTYNGSGKDNLGYPFNKAYQNGAAQIQPASPDLKWETDEQTDIGIDAAFLQGHLTLTADWFNRNSRDFLLNLAAPAQTGYQSISRNVGSMNNKGFELALGYKNDIGSDFHFGANLSLTTIKNTLTSITAGTPFIGNFTNPSGSISATGQTLGTVTLTGQGWDEFSHSYVGRPVGEFFGYKSLGIIQTQAQLDALNAGSPTGIYYQAATRPGDRLFADTNGDGKVDATDRTSIGSPQPKFFGGLNLDGSYKAWDFNLFFYGSFGNKILNYVESNLETFQKRGSEGVENVSTKYNDNYWTPDRPSNRYARPLANDDNNLNSVPSDVWVEDGSFVKLKTVTIGYTLPTAMLSRLSISRLRVYVSAQNLFWITKYSGLDPEVGIQGGNATLNGVDNGTYPSSKSYTVGLNVSF